MLISDWSSDVCSSDLEAVLLQRHADDLEGLALGGQGERDRIAGVAGQDRRRPRVVDAHAFVAALLFVALVIVGVIDLAQPFGDLAVRSVDADRMSTRLNSSH